MEVVREGKGEEERGKGRDVGSEEEERRGMWGRKRRKGEGCEEVVVLCTSASIFLMSQILVSSLS
jgi:hypothetical protein